MLNSYGVFLVNYSIGSYLLSALKGLGIKRIYGIPGDLIIDFFKMIEDDPQLELITLCHEPGVGFAAIGEARATNRPAVACITFGAGGLNMMNAVACAFAEKTPLIVISGGAPRHKVTTDVWLHHTIKGPDSQLMAYRQITEEAVVLDAAKTAPTQIQLALKTCQEYLLPVYIEIPVDMANKEIVMDPNQQTFQFIADEKVVAQAADELVKKGKAGGKARDHGWRRNGVFPFKRRIDGVGKKMEHTRCYLAFGKRHYS